MQAEAQGLCSRERSTAGSGALPCWAQPRRWCCCAQPPSPLRPPVRVARLQGRGKGRGGVRRLCRRSGTKNAGPRPLCVLAANSGPRRRPVSRYAAALTQLGLVALHERQALALQSAGHRAPHGSCDARPRPLQLACVVGCRCGPVAGRMRGAVRCPGSPAKRTASEVGCGAPLHPPPPQPTPHAQIRTPSAHALHTLHVRSHDA
jgi:hypothetical protein